MPSIGIWMKAETRKKLEEIAGDLGRSLSLTISQLVEERHAQKFGPNLPTIGQLSESVAEIRTDLDGTKQRVAAITNKLAGL